MAKKIERFYLRMRNRLEMSEEGQSVLEYAVVLLLIALVFALNQRNTALAPF